MPTIVTEPRTQTSNRANPYLAGNYAPIDFETTSFALPVKGTIPEQLSGRLVRIGPNPSRLPDAEHAHWFTGLGMVHGLRLSDGRADWYRSRYVRAGRGARLLGLYVAPGPAGYDDFNVNTTVLHLGDGMYACVEAGAFPVELSYELDSISRSDLGGGLKCGFAEHAKTAPQTGEHFAIACQPGKPHVQYLVVGNDGVARQRAEIEPPHMPLIHDIAITQSSVIVLDLPVTFQSAKAKSGDFPYAWDGKREARVGLLPRDGNFSGMQWFEAPTCFVFHCLNSYDDGTSVVLDVCRHPRMFASGNSDVSEGNPVLARWILDRVSGKLSDTIVDDHGSEFPRVNSTRESLSYRYGYTAAAQNGGKLGPTMKHDLATGITEVHDYGRGRLALEPIFVAKTGAAAEDDGWVMSYVYDADRNASDIVILSAQDFSGPPVATIELPVRVPFGFHGNWVPDRKN